MRSLFQLLRRLSPRFIAVTLAIVLAVPFTAFYGSISSQVILEKWSAYFSPWPFAFLDWLGNTIVIAVAVIAVLYFCRWLYGLFAESPTSQESSPTKYRLLDDMPVGKDGVDEFERDRFVKTLSRTIVLPPKANSLVVALESPWGSGKSSVLDLLCRELDQHPDKPLVIKFNPWLATGQDRIFRAFFSQFSASLLDKNEHALADGLVRFGEALEDLLPARARMFPRMGFRHIRRLVGRIPIIDLEGERENLHNSVAQLERPIVVIIDDIDRLPPGDIAVIFQLVKAIASFPRVAYLLAFDPEPIDRALAFGGDPKAGRDFRDKIVQANLSLPRIRYGRRKQYFSSTLHERFKSWQFDVDAREERVLDRAIPLVLAALRTPRDMKRVLNKTLMAAENVRAEVNIADVLVLETIHAKFPKVSDLIRQNPSVVDPSGYGDEEVSGGDISRIVRERMEEDRGKAELLSELTDLYPNDRDTLADLLTFAFPKKFAEMPDPEDHDPAGDLRITIPENLLKVLYQGLHGEILSASEAETVLTDESSRRAILADALEARTLPEWFSHLRKFVRSTDVAAPTLLMKELVNSTNALYEQTRIDSSGEVRWLLLDLLEVTPSQERTSALEDLLGDHRTASVSEQVLTSLLQYSGLWANGEYRGPNRILTSAENRFEVPSPEDLDRLRHLWLSTVRELGMRNIVLIYPNVGGVLFRWGQLAEPPFAEVASEVDDALEDSRIAQGLVDAFPPGISLSGTERFILDSAWQKLQSFLTENEVPESTKEKFLEYFDDRFDSAAGDERPETDDEA